MIFHQEKYLVTDIFKHVLFQGSPSRGSILLLIFLNMIYNQIFDQDKDFVLDVTEHAL